MKNKKKEKMNKEQTKIYTVCFILLAISLAGILASVKPLNETGITGFHVATIEQHAEQKANVSEKTEEHLAESFELARESQEHLEHSGVGNVTRETALFYINEAEADMKEMMEAGLGVAYISDSLIAARLALERADYAELLKKESVSNPLIEAAKKALEGLNYEGFSYKDVLIYTSGVKSIKERAFNISDSLKVLEWTVNDYKGLGVDTAKSIEFFNKAKEAFANERYDEAEQFISKTEAQLWLDRAQVTLLRVMINASKGFIEQHFIGIIISSLVAFAVFLLAWRKIRRAIARKKLENFKLEKGVITKLIAKTQREHFVESTIPVSTYRIRMAKFNERLVEINHTIPVLEAILERKSRKEK